MTNDNKTPQPVVNTQLIAQGIGIVLGLLVALGFITTGQSDALSNVGVYVIGGIPVVAGVVASFQARKKVTPSAKPSDNDGQPLATVADLRNVANAAYEDGHTTATSAADAALSEALAAQRDRLGILVTPDEIPPAENALEKEDVTA